LEYKRLFKPARIIYEVVRCTGSLTFWLNFCLILSLISLVLTDWNSAHLQFARLAKFLRSMPLPANQYTAVSLDAFLRLSDPRLILLCLQMAGFALFKRYKSKFIKMLKVILVNFLVNLKSYNVPESKFIAANIHSYTLFQMLYSDPIIVFVILSTSVISYLWMSISIN
jgi:hypothetical protein